jgi:hypothetical protein
LPNTSHINQSLLAAYYTSKNEAIPKDLLEKLNALLLKQENFIIKIKSLDTIIDDYKINEDVGELIFDIMLYHFFSEDSQRLGESFFDTKEWEVIEEAIMDRGTELMNLLLYLQECSDSDIKPSIDDYLDEYLVAEDDFDNEEFEVYEAIIKNRELINEGDLQAMLEISRANEHSALNDQLLPLLLFFEPKNNLDNKNKLILTDGKNPAFQTAFLAVLSSF